MTRRRWAIEIIENRNTGELQEEANEFLKTIPIERVRQFMQTENAIGSVPVVTLTIVYETEIEIEE